MSRTLKTVAVVIAVVSLLTLVVSGTIYALGADRCPSGDSGCAQQHRAGCIGSSGCTGPGECSGVPRCYAGSQP